MDYQQFKEFASTYDIDVSKAQHQALMIYANHLIDYNKKVNLTAIVEIDQIFIKHFLDSLLVLKHLKDNQHVADIGSGAGFPGLVLAIFLPNTNFSLIEPTNKRVVFLNEMIDILHLNNVNVIQSRAEDSKDKRETFDVVVSRAVARLDILVELCVPLLKLNGLFIALKGAHANDEIEVSNNALKVLKATIEDVEEIELHYDNEIAKRNNVIIRKLEKTPNKYPRLYSKIKKQPL